MMGNDLDFEEAIEKLKNEDSKIRKIAINSLEGTDNESAINPLIEATTDESAPIRFKAAEILGNMGDVAIDMLIERFNNESGQNKRLLSFALKESASPKIIECLAGAVSDEDFGVRKVAIRTLGELKAEDKTNLIAKGMEDEDWGVRLAAIYALGDIATEESVGLIKKARRKEKDKDFKKSCNKSIKKAEKSMKGGSTPKKVKGKPFKEIKDLEKENINEAIKEYEKYLKENAETDVPYKRLAIIYKKMRNDEDELRVLNQAVEVLASKNPGKEKWFEDRLNKMK